MSESLPLTIGAGQDRLVDVLDQVVAVDASQWATVVIDSSSAHVDADQRLDTRWKNARRQLDEAGFGAVLEDLDGRVGDLGHQSGAALCFVVGDEDVVVAGELSQAPDQDVVRTGRLPSLVPVLVLERTDIAHLIVLADREGADITVVGRDRSNAESTVRGDEEHIHKGQPGGWSQRRFQQRAENTWEDNAQDVADQVLDLADRIGAELIVAAGDGRALGLLREHLPQRLVEHLVEPEGPSRHDPGTIEEQAATAVEDHVARAATERLSALRNGIGEGVAVAGPETVDLLGEGLIDEVLVGAGVEGPVGYLGSRPELVAGTPGRLEQLGEDPVEVDLVDLAVFAAIRTGATITVVPGRAAALSDGVGGFRRDA